MRDPEIPTAGTDPTRRRRRPGLSDSTPFTGRAVLLGLVLAGLVLSFALPVREYVRQRGEITALQAEKAQREARVAELEQRLGQWKDPAFISTQARQRLQYVMPGEVGYVVLDPQEAPAPIVRDQVSAAAVEGTPWYATLWRSVEAADAVQPAAPESKSTETSPAPKSSAPKASTSPSSSGG
jgi:cell division protein FtsB